MKIKELQLLQSSEPTPMQSPPAASPVKITILEPKTSNHLAELHRQRLLQIDAQKQEIERIKRE